MATELAKEEQVPELRSRACKLCLFAAWDEISLYERAIRAADLVVIGWCFMPVNLFIGRRLVAADIWLDRSGF